MLIQDETPQVTLEDFNLDDIIENIDSYMSKDPSDFIEDEYQ